MEVYTAFYTPPQMIADSQKSFCRPSKTIRRLILRYQNQSTGCAGWKTRSIAPRFAQGSDFPTLRRFCRMSVVSVLSGRKFELDLCSRRLPSPSPQRNIPGWLFRHPAVPRFTCHSRESWNPAPSVDHLSRTNVPLFRENDRIISRFSAEAGAAPVSVRCTWRCPCRRQCTASRDPSSRRAAPFRGAAW